MKKILIFLAIYLQINCVASVAQQRTTIDEFKLSLLVSDITKWKTSGFLGSTVPTIYDVRSPFIWTDGKMGDHGGAEHGDIRIEVNKIDFPCNMLFAGRPVFNKKGELRYFVCDSFRNSDEYRVRYCFNRGNKCYYLYCRENLKVYPDYKRGFEKIANSIQFFDSIGIKTTPAETVFTPSGQHYYLSDYQVKMTLPNIVDWKPSHLYYFGISRYQWKDLEYAICIYPENKSSLYIQFEKCISEKKNIRTDVLDKRGNMKYSVVDFSDKKNLKSYKVCYIFNHNKNCYELFCYADLEKFPGCKSEFEKIAESVKFDVSCDTLNLKQFNTFPK